MWDESPGLFVPQGAVVVERINCGNKGALTLHPPFRAPPGDVCRIKARHQCVRTIIVAHHLSADAPLNPPHAAQLSEPPPPSPLVESNLPTGTIASLLSLSSQQLTRAVLCSGSRCRLPSPPASDIGTVSPPPLPAHPLTPSATSPFDIRLRTRALPNHIPITCRGTSRSCNSPLPPSTAAAAHFRRRDPP